VPLCALSSQALANLRRANLLRDFKENTRACLQLDVSLLENGTESNTEPRSYDVARRQCWGFPNQLSSDS
jgi:hypothetical protein